jgi:hypothetical protein
VAGVSQFNHLVVPQMKVTYLSPKLVRKSWGEISLLGAVAFYAASRQGQISYDGISQQGSQNCYVTTAHVGALFEPNILRWRILTPYISLGVVPTLVLANRSLLSDEQMLGGLMVEGEVGLAARVYTGWEIVGSLMKSFGLVQSGLGDLAGWGVQGSVRYAL